MKEIQMLPLLLFVLGISISSVTGQRASYGEACNKTMRCDRRQWLTCSKEGICDCMKAEEMMYDEVLGKCASKAGESCKFILEAMDENNIMFQVTDCIRNSTCSPDGFCTCDDKFYEDSNGTCTPSPSYLENCDSQIKCSKFEGLQCINGTCWCDELKSVYLSDGENSQCVGLAGHSCINSRCDEHSSCGPENKCSCDDGYFRNDEGKCVLKLDYSKNCTSNEQCKMFKGSQLICLHGVCDCNPQYSRYGTAKVTKSNYFYYDSSNYFEGSSYTKCLRIVGSPCVERLCGPRAYCDNGGICACLNGYTKSSKGTCGRDINQECETDEGCIDGLVCKNRKCLCPYGNQEFDSSRKVCMNKVGGPCKSTSPCVPNAECNLFSTSPQEAGHCLCKDGFVKNAQGKCDVGFGQPCNLDVACDTVLGLVCTNKLCRCNEFEQYNEIQRKCLGRAGRECDLSLAFRGNTCVENAHCAQIHPKLGTGVCTCESGFNETPEYLCERNGIAEKGPAHDEE